MNNLKKKIKFVDRYEMLSVCEIIQKFQGLIYKKAMSFHAYVKAKFYKHECFLSFEDIQQIGNMGLIKAYNNYDESKDMTFMTYAYPVVQGEILRHIRDIANPRRKGPNSYDFKDVHLDADLNNDHRYGGGDCKVHLQETIPDEHDYIEEFIENDLLKSLMSLLTDRERKLIELQFVHGKTQVQIAEMIGISQVQVSRISKKGLLKMREHIKIQKKKEEEIVMQKLKPSINEIVVYFETHATKDVAFSTTSNRLARELDLSVSTLLKIIKASDKEEYLKYLCKPSTSLIKKHCGGVEQIKKEMLAAKGIVESTEENAVCIDDLRTEDVKRILEDTPGATVETNKYEKIFEGVEIHYLTIRFNNQNTATFSEKNIKLDNFAQWNTREELVQCKNNMEKALEIHDFLFSK